MAYGDYGALLPTEALFEEPGAYSGVLKAEALKRASYLSSMDQFYAELDESSKRFEQQYSLAEREFEFGQEQSLWEREFAETGREGETALASRQLDLQAELGRGELALGRSELGIKQGQLSLSRSQLDLQEEEMERSLTGAEEFKMATDWLEEFSPNPTTSKIYSPPKQETAFFESPGYEMLTPGVPGVDWIETVGPDGVRSFSA